MCCLYTLKKYWPEPPILDWYSYCDDSWVGQNATRIFPLVVSAASEANWTNWTELATWNDPHTWAFCSCMLASSLFEHSSRTQIWPKNKNRWGCCRTGHTIATRTDLVSVSPACNIKIDYTQLIKESAKNFPRKMGESTPSASMSLHLMLNTNEYLVF